VSEQIRIDQQKALAREVEGELVILDVESKMYIGGNRSTAVLWPLLQEGATAERLTEALVDHFAIEPERARADVDGFVSDLRKRALLAES
jgi:hypothetical protein